ncbi:hypothetical protein K2Z84_01630 [Candidatus Binatia bacterium]|nr:hypothetical protein [Candidatus Binatia bacterium]
MWYLLASEEFASKPSPEPMPAASRPPATCDQTSRSFEMDDVLRQAEALLRFSGEVENRMVESGLGGVNGVIERYIQLRQALDRLSQRELDWAKGEVDRLIATLTGVAEQLEQLRAIKLAIVDQR